MSVPEFATLEVCHKCEVVDGVLRYPPVGTSVLVVGGGPCGYMTALECWRKGLDVRIVEKADKVTVVGDSFLVGPSGLATLKCYPSMLQEYHDGKIAWDNFLSFRRLDGFPLMPSQELEYNRNDVPHHAAWPLRVKAMVSRAGFTNMLHKQCLRLGIPITFGTNVVEYTENAGAAFAITDDGRTFTADIVVAADGLGTKSHKAILGESVRALPTGSVVFRSFYRPDPEKNPNLSKHLTSSRPDLRLYSGRDFHCLVSASTDHVLLGITLPQAGTTPQEQWSSTVSVGDLISRLPDMDRWDPLMKEAVRNIPGNNVIEWQLCFREPQTKWTTTNGRIVQAGDSAHAFIPTSGSGVTTALEDALSLAECLRMAGGDPRAGVKVHELLRVRRVSVLQRLGFVNRGELHREGGLEATVQEMDDRQPMSLGKWIWTHNAESYATSKFAEAYSHVKSGSGFTDANLPVGFSWQPWSMESELEMERRVYL
ncbi:FAD-dependent monooxygenase [Colletotrichum siamense]|nr:FAD-dependent monooxygenase [Colletotrichum siamense]